MKNAIKDFGTAIIRTTAIAEGALAYGCSCAMQAMTYGVTTNQTARELTDMMVSGSQLLLIGASTIGKEEEEFFGELKD